MNYQTSDHDVYSVMTIVQPTVNNNSKTNTNDKQGKDLLISLFVMSLGCCIREESEKTVTAYLSKMVGISHFLT